MVLSIEDFFGFQFLVFGLVPLGLTIIATIVVTRDMRKMKIILFPMHLLLTNIGFGTSVIAGVIFALLFVFESFSFRGLSDYFTQIRKDIETTVRPPKVKTPTPKITQNITNKISQATKSTRSFLDEKKPDLTLEKVDKQTKKLKQEILNR